MCVAFAENLEYSPILWWIGVSTELKTKLDTEDLSKAAVGADDLNLELGYWTGQIRPMDF